MAQRTCGVEGCEKKHRARGLCSSHYNATFSPDRHRRENTCEECGTRYETTRSDGRYCSLRCRDARARSKKAVVGPLPRTPRNPSPVAIRVARPRRWVAGSCARCGTPFVARIFSNPDRYCSRECARRSQDARHRSTHGNPGSGWIAPRIRYAIYHSAGWKCGLCGQQVDRTLPYNHDWAASLDHITPRSRGGSDERDNLRLAHRLCNAIRRDSLDPDVT